MQRNPPLPTIEGELERALVAAGCISEANANSFSKVHWMRAARTDKGVSAVCQVVSARLVMAQRRGGEQQGEQQGEDKQGQEQQQQQGGEEPKEEATTTAAASGPPADANDANEASDPVVARINAELPKAVRVYGWRRVTEGFDARKWCDRRRYEYVLPAWVFDRELFTRPLLPEDAATTAGRSLAANPDAASAALSSAAHSVTLNSVTDVSVDRSGLPPHEIAAVRAAVRAAEAAAPPVDEALLNRIFARYQGTHNFHNFTAKVDPGTSEAKRHVLYFRCEGVVDVAGGGGRWVKLAVLGQSFMLHQIRKMVGLAAAVARGLCPVEALDAALDPNRDYAVPMAPALGLLLDEAFFDGYNQRWAALHGPLALEPFRAQAEALKASGVYPHMASCDREGLVYALWARSLEVAAPRGYKFARWPGRAPVRSLGSAFGSSKRAREELAAAGAGAVVGDEGKEEVEVGAGRAAAAKKARTTSGPRVGGGGEGGGVGAGAGAGGVGAAAATTPAPTAAAKPPAASPKTAATTPVIAPAEAQALLGDLYDEL